MEGFSAEDELMQVVSRRKHPRFGVRRLVSYHYGGKRFLTLTLDLALGGMRIETPDHLPEGEDLDTQIVLENRSIWLKGRTVYSHLLSDTMNVSGIQFLTIAEEDRALLEKFLGRLHRLPLPQGMISTGKGEVRTNSRKAGQK